MVWQDMVWQDMVWQDMVWQDMVWQDMVWQDMVDTGQANLIENIKSGSAPETWWRRAFDPYNTL